MLPLMFGVFSLIIAGALVLRGKFRWSWFETLVTVAVIVCIVVWLSAGSTAAFWASILSLFLASLPQMVEAHNKPEAMFRIPWLFYWLACFVTVIGLISQGKERIDELIYAGMGIFTLGVMIFFIYTRPSSNQSSID